MFWFDWKKHAEETWTYPKPPWWMVLTVACNSVAVGLFPTHLNKMHFINLWLWSALGSRTVWSRIRCYICTQWLCISLEQITAISQRLWLGRRGDDWTLAPCPRGRVWWTSQPQWTWHILLYLYAQDKTTPQRRGTLQASYTESCGWWLISLF